VGYVKKKHPELAEYISHTPSPMVAIGLHIKEQDPDAKVVFIGPCIAKKREAQLGRTRNAIDCVLTYEELFSLFRSKDIDVEQLEPSPLSEASPYARNFAYSGGVAAAVAQAMKEKGTDKQFDLKAVPCSGIAACEVALLKMKRGMFEGNFLEGMACEGGCVQGAGCLVRSPRNKMDVLNYAKKAEGRDILGALSNKAQVPADSTGEEIISLPVTSGEKTEEEKKPAKKPAAKKAEKAEEAK
jgi:iron only hydrogenase large subunit-like protein